MAGPSQCRPQGLDRSYVAQGPPSVRMHRSQKPPFRNYNEQLYNDKETSQDGDHLASCQIGSSAMGTQDLDCVRTIGCDVATIVNHSIHEKHDLSIRS